MRTLPAVPPSPRPCPLQASLVVPPAALQQLLQPAPCDPRALGLALVPRLVACSNSNNNLDREFTQPAHMTILIARTHSHGNSLCVLLSPVPGQVFPLQATHDPDLPAELACLVPPSPCGRQQAVAFHSQQAAGWRVRRRRRRRRRLAWCPPRGPRPTRSTLCKGP